MRAGSRIKRIREIEKLVAKAAAKGWRVENVTYSDTPGEDFEASFVVSVSDSEHDGIM